MMHSSPSSEAVIAPPPLVQPLSKQYQASNDSSSDTYEYAKELNAYDQQLALQANSTNAAKAAIWSSVGTGAFGIMSNEFKKAWAKSDKTQSFAHRVGFSLAHALTPGLPSAFRTVHALAKATHQVYSTSKYLHATRTPLDLIHVVHHAAGAAPPSVSVPVRHAMGLTSDVLEASAAAHAYGMSNDMSEEQINDHINDRVKKAAGDYAVKASLQHVPGITDAQRDVLSRLHSAPLEYSVPLAAAAAMNANPVDMKHAADQIMDYHSKTVAVQALSASARADKMRTTAGRDQDRSYTHHTLALLDDAARSTSNDPDLRNFKYRQILQKAQQFQVNEAGQNNGLADTYSKGDIKKYPYSQMGYDKYASHAALFDHLASGGIPPAFIDEHGSILHPEDLESYFDTQLQAHQQAATEHIKTTLTNRLNTLAVSPDAYTTGSDRTDAFRRAFIDEMQNKQAPYSMQDYQDALTASAKKARDPNLAHIHALADNITERARRVALSVDHPQHISPADMVNGSIQDGLNAAIIHTQGKDKNVHTAVSLAATVHQLAMDHGDSLARGANGLLSEWHNIDHTTLMHTVGQKADEAVHEGARGWLSAFVDQDPDEVRKAAFQQLKDTPGNKVVPMKQRLDAPPNDPAPPNDQRPLEHGLARLRPVPPDARPADLPSHTVQFDPDTINRGSTLRAMTRESVPVSEPRILPRSAEKATTPSLDASPRPDQNYRARPISRESFTVSDPRTLTPPQQKAALLQAPTTEPSLSERPTPLNKDKVDSVTSTLVHRIIQPNAREPVADGAVTMNVHYAKTSDITAGARSSVVKAEDGDASSIKSSTSSKRRITSTAIPVRKAPSSEEAFKKRNALITEHNTTLESEHQRIPFMTRLFTPKPSPLTGKFLQPRSPERVQVKTGDTAEVNERAKQRKDKQKTLNLEPLPAPPTHSQDEVDEHNAKTAQEMLSGLALPEDPYATEWGSRSKKKKGKAPAMTSVDEDDDYSKPPQASPIVDPDTLPEPDFKSDQNAHLQWALRHSDSEQVYQRVVHHQQLRSAFDSEHPFTSWTTPLALEDPDLRTRMQTAIKKHKESAAIDDAIARDRAKGRVVDEYRARKLGAVYETAPDAHTAIKSAEERGRLSRRQGHPRPASPPAIDEYTPHYGPEHVSSKAAVQHHAELTAEQHGWDNASTGDKVVGFARRMLKRSPPDPSTTAEVTDSHETASDSDQPSGVFGGSDHRPVDRLSKQPSQPSSHPAMAAMHGECNSGGSPFQSFEGNTITKSSTPDSTPAPAQPPPTSTTPAPEKTSVSTQATPQTKPTTNVPAKSVDSQSGASSANPSESNSVSTQSVPTPQPAVQTVTPAVNPADTAQTSDF